MVMHWYDWLILIVAWSLIPACFAARSYLDWQWEKNFGEKKPR